MVIEKDYKVTMDHEQHGCFMSFCDDYTIADFIFQKLKHKGFKGNLSLEEKVLEILEEV